MLKSTTKNNKISFYSGRITRNLWSMARGSFTSLRDTLALAQGHQEQVEDDEGRTGQLPGEVRKPSYRSTGKTGDDNPSDGGDEFRIREYEQRYLENKRKIHALEDRIIEFIAEQFLSGEVNKLPLVVGLSKPLPGGLQMKLLHVNNEFDVFLCHGEEGAGIVKHTHDKTQTVYVLTGKVLYALKGDQNEEIKRVLEKGDHINIDAERPHRIKLLDDAKYIVVYRPPISFNPLNMGRE